MPKKQVTSIDVAKFAGVSQPTVSRAFDPNSPVSPETRARVLTAAKQLGYQPNVIARSLKSRSTNIIGIVLANITNSLFYPNVLEQLTYQLQERGKQTLLFNLRPDQPVDDILPRVLGYQVDGLIIASTTPSHEIVNKCVSNGTPVVLFNRYMPGSRAHTISCDSETATRHIANVLLDAGHKRLAYIAGIENTETNRQREKGFTEQLQARGYKGLLREQGDYTYESGRTAARRLLQRDEPPDAIFCAADIMALGAMDVARYELGIHIPEALSIIGFDDIPVAGWPAYNLTTIRQPITDMVNTVIELLDVQNTDTGQLVQLPGELILRQSARL